MRRRRGPECNAACLVVIAAEAAHVNLDLLLLFLLLLLLLLVAAAAAAAAYEIQSNERLMRGARGGEPCTKHMTGGAAPS
jgi:hypothetical protein